MTDLCVYHLRIGQHVPATRKVNGDPMCADCYAGKPLHREHREHQPRAPRIGQHVDAEYRRQWEADHREERNRYWRERKRVMAARQKQLGVSRPY